MKNLAVVLVNVLLLNSIFYGQNTDALTSEKKTFSESNAYQPELLPEPAKKAKKKSEKTKVVIPTPPKAEFVKIPVSVFNEQGKFITNLKPDDFKVFVDGQEENFEVVENNSEPLNLVVLVDVSPSTAYNLDELQEFTLTMIDSLKPADKAQIIKFSGKFEILTEMTNDRKVIEKAVKKIKFDDGTSLYGAVSTIFNNHAQNIEPRRALVILTDGVDTTSQDSGYNDSLVAAEKYDMPVYPIYFNTFREMKEAKKKAGDFLTSINRSMNLGSMGVSETHYVIGRYYLNSLVNLSGGRAISSEKIYSDQGKNQTYIAEEMRLKYFLKIKIADSLETDKRRQIKVRVNRPNLQVISRGSYIAN